MGLGGFLNDVLGGTDNYQDNYHVDNPYTQAQLAQQLSNGNQIYGQQQGLAQALLAQSQGQGPNPALDQLKMTTDQNNQAAASMAASQRGLNPALAARMAIQSQATNNQNAGQQAAILRAQQQLASQQQLGGLYGQMGNQTLNQQGIMNSANNAAEGINTNAQAINAGVAATNANNAGKLGAGLISGAGAVGAAASMPSPAAAAGATKAPVAAPAAAAALSRGGRVPGKANVRGDSYANDTVPAMLSPGEILIPRSHSSDPEMAKEFIDELMKSKKRKAQPGGFGKVIEAHRKLTQALQGMKAGAN